ncbi:MAG: TetR/AcrR family transcriptional regulator, regulator of autoinduction and epiphytic fitness [Thermoleophilales bacterium]|nr:TetR family transcriptional regulator [Frankiales bacterium]MEA2446272.1 TetR/AcrR family transcriptional regulator, regulator of autoinduction and epiphytic fitness [Thermoleophilales bacterium]
MSTVDADLPVDGRNERSRRTREAVVDALLALHDAGDLTPTAQRVAAKAGVALRTVYGHFNDMETLYAEAGERELRRLYAVAEVVPPELPLPERIEWFCRSRARVLEYLLPVMRATRLREPFSPQLARNRSRYIASADAEVERVFARELSGAQGPKTLDALYLATGGPAWDALRTDRHLDPTAAEAVMRRTVTALLATEGAA